MFSNGHTDISIINYTTVETLYVKPFVSDWFFGFLPHEIGNCKSHNAKLATLEKRNG
jgi:hypothetical protein